MQYSFNRRLGGPGNQFEHFGEEKRTCVNQAWSSGPSRQVAISIVYPSCILKLREFHFKTLHELANIPVQNFSARDRNLQEWNAVLLGVHVRKLGDTVIPSAEGSRIHLAA